MWNTSVLFLSLLAWPVTAGWGPVAAYNLLVTAGVALAAWLGFLAARRLLDGWWPALLAGLVYGFSPGLLAQGTRHLHVLFQLFPPLVLILGHDLLVSRRRNPLLIGALGGAAAAFQLLIGEEVLAVTLLIALLGFGLLAWLHRSSALTRAAAAGPAVAAALAAFLVLAAYPLWLQFAGPQRVAGQLQPVDRYVSDLLAFVVPSQFTLLQTPTTAWIAGHFTGNPSENDAYIGLPLLGLFAAGLAVNRGRAAIRWAGLMAVAVAVLSLGPHLHVFGVNTGIPLPWLALAQLPLMGDALPARLMLPAYLGLGIVVASLWEPLGRARPAWRWSGALLALLGLAALIPVVPFPESAAVPPPFFRAAGGVEQLRPGTVLLVTPFSSRNSTDAMYWQEVAGFRFRMPEGDVFTPGPQLGPPPTHLQASLDRLSQGGEVAVSGLERSQALQDISDLGVKTIAVGPEPAQDAVVRYFTEILGVPPEQSGGVAIWWRLPGAGPSRTSGRSEPGTGAR